MADDVQRLTALTTEHFGLGIEDFLLGRAINRIRHYYLERAGETARYFMLSGSDDAVGVLGNMGIVPTPRQLYFTAAIAVAVVNAVVGGAAVALAIGIAFGTSLAVAIVIGAAAAVIVVGAAMRYQRPRRGAGTQHPVLFPSDAP